LSTPPLKTVTVDSMAAGSVVALPLSGPVITRFGSRRTVTATALLLAVGLAAVALGFLLGVLPVVVGLFLGGLGMGAWDVAMNVQGPASSSSPVGRSCRGSTAVSAWVRSPVR
jgi:MFS family permease